CSEPTGMVAVFVSDKNRIDAVRILSNRFEPLCNFLPAHSDIDQDSHTFAFDESRISAASACQHRDCYCHEATMSDRADRTGDCTIGVMNHYVAIALMAAGVVVFGCAGQSPNKSSNDALRSQLDEDWKYWMAQYPELATEIGYPGQNMRWTDYSQSAIDG